MKLILLAPFSITEMTNKSESRVAMPGQRDPNRLGLVKDKHTQIHK